MKSFTTKPQIVDFLVKWYCIDVFSIKEIDRGNAILYNINENKFVLKIFQEKYKKEDIIKEAEIFELLKENNIPAPEYIKNIDDEYFTIFNGRVAILQKFILGHEVDKNTGDINMLLDSARILGKIVQVLNSCDNQIMFPNNGIESWYSDKSIKESIEKHQDLLKLAIEQDKNDIVEDLKYKIKLLRNVKKEFALDELSKLTCLNTHGDYNVLQCIYGDDNKIKAVLDFVSACKMPVVWEIIRSYSYLDKKAVNGYIDINNLKTYVTEFMKYQDLSDYDLKYMGLLYFIQILTSTYGYRQYLNDNSEIDMLEFAKFRTNMCNYLYKNMDKISKEIQNIVI